MKSGYDQFFQKARKAADSGATVKKPAPQGMKLADFEKRLNQSHSQQEAARRPSKNMAEDLRARVRVQGKKQKVRKAFPFKLVGISLMGLLVTSLGVWKADEMEKIIQGVEISLLGQARAENVKPVSAAPIASPVKKDEEPGVKKEFSQDEINHFSRLNERKRELDSREEELNRMETELQSQRDELDKKLNDLDKTRRGIATVLEERVQADDKKIENLVQMYSSMKPQQAAKAFEEMDEDLAVEILGRMKKRNAAEVMNLVKSEKVKILSEKYAGYKQTTP